MILRNFLYLDTVAVDNYLSSLEGSVGDEHFEQTETEKKGKGGKAGISKVVSVEANLSSDMTSETKQKRIFNPSAKFQRFYEILEEQDAIQLLDAFDPNSWPQFRKGEVLEVEATTTIPSIFLVKEATDAAGPMAAIATLFGQNPLTDPETFKQFELAGAAAELFEKQQIPLLFNASSTPRFNFLAFLSRDFLKYKPSVLQGEATVFGKILRVIPKGQKYEYTLVHQSLLPQIVNLNRTQRKKLEKNQEVKQEILKGPAIIMEAIAIYR